MADQARWPRGTPVAPGGRGPGGGRFRDAEVDWADLAVDRMMPARNPRLGLSRAELQDLIDNPPESIPGPPRTLPALDAAVQMMQDELGEYEVQHDGAWRQMASIAPLSVGGLLYRSWVPEQLQWEVGRDEPVTFRRHPPPYTREDISDGGGSYTQRVVWNDGRRVVVKGGGATRDTDAEYLASLVGQAVGAPVPEVLRISSQTVWMGHVSGDSGMMVAQKRGLDPYEVTDDWEEIWADQEPGWRLGLLDVLIMNEDRHHGNWLFEDPSDPASIVGIDHGRAWWVADRLRPVEPGERPIGLKPDWTAIRRAVYDGAVPHGWRTDRTTLQEVQQMDARIRALEPEFLALDRGRWFDHTLAAWDSFVAAMQADHG